MKYYLITVIREGNFSVQGTFAIKISPAQWLINADTNKGHGQYHIIWSMEIDASEYHKQIASRR